MPSHFPPWLKKRFPATGNFGETQAILDRLGLRSVCQGAMCPNIGECFASKTATFMILGSVCSRNCRFCAVPGGRPVSPDPEEPRRVAQAVQELGLRHVVVTSVTRDDLPDGGAGHFAATIHAVRALAAGVAIEVLTPDFGGDKAALAAVVSARPEIYNHNVETVPRLYPKVRPQAGYGRSLHLLRSVKELDSSVFTKSGLMVGLGETQEEVYSALADLRSAGCDIVTVGQYLQPSPKHLEIAEFISPEVFEKFREAAVGMGFLYAACGPFVRSSYHAGEFSQQFICL